VLRHHSGFPRECLTGPMAPHTLLLMGFYVEPIDRGSMMYVNSRSVVVLVLLVLLLAVLSGCAGLAPMRADDPRGLDRKLSTFAWIEDGDVMTLIVDTKATRYREETAYIPLEVAISNNGLKQISLTRESFTLMDEEGNRYPLATPTELMKGYEYLDFDRTHLSELPGIVFNRYAAYAFYPSKFSPTRALGGIVHDSLPLPKFGYTIDVLYFPSPTTGVVGHEFELFVDAPELEDPIFVKFMVK